jgi:hypothetical protein
MHYQSRAHNQRFNFIHTNYFLGKYHNFDALFQEGSFSRYATMI